MGAVSSVTANGTYVVGGIVDVTVLFSEPVTVTGTPQIILEAGSIDRTANYIAGTSSNTLLFRYTVQSGDTSADLDYIDTSSFVLNGGIISTVASPNNDAILILPPTGIILEYTPAGIFGSLALNKDLCHRCNYSDTLYCDTKRGHRHSGHHF